MKLRIKGNSIRLRLDRRDLSDLLDNGRIEDSVKFGPEPDRSLVYAVEVGRAPRSRPAVTYDAGRIVVSIDRFDAEAWHGSDQVGFDHEQPVQGGAVRILLEKDFACLDRPASEETDDAWAFPNPATVC